MIGHFEEKNENKYLVLDDVDENKVSKKYEEVQEGVKKEIETINGGERVEYGKDFKKIRFGSNDYLPMNKPMRLRLLAIIIRCVLVKVVNFIHNFFWMTLCMSHCKNATVRTN